MGPSTGMERCGKSPPTGIRSPDRPARSESLYRLSYPGTNTHTHTHARARAYMYIYSSRVNLIGVESLNLYIYIYIVL